MVSPTPLHTELFSPWSLHSHVFHTQNGKCWQHCRYQSCRTILQTCGKSSEGATACCYLCKGAAVIWKRRPIYQSLSMEPAARSWPEACKLSPLPTYLPVMVAGGPVLGKTTWIRHVVHHTALHLLHILRVQRIHLPLVKWRPRRIRVIAISLHLVSLPYRLLSCAVLMNGMVHSDYMSCLMVDDGYLRYTDVPAWRDWRTLKQMGI